MYIYFILHCYSEYDCIYKQTHNNKIKGTYVGRLISYFQGVGRDIRLCKRRNHTQQLIRGAPLEHNEIIYLYPSMMSR